MKRIILVLIIVMLCVSATDVVYAKTARKRTGRVKGCWVSLGEVKYSSAEGKYLLKMELMPWVKGLHTGYNFDIYLDQLNKSGWLLTDSNKAKVEIFSADTSARVRKAPGPISYNKNRKELLASTENGTIRIVGGERKRAFGGTGFYYDVLTVEILPILKTGEYILLTTVGTFASDTAFGYGPVITNVSYQPSSKGDDYTEMLISGINFGDKQGGAGVIGSNSDVLIEWKDNYVRLQVKKSDLHTEPPPATGGYSTAGMLLSLWVPNVGSATYDLVGKKMYWKELHLWDYVGAENK